MSALALPVRRPVPPPPLPVSLADRCGRAFPPLACLRGYRYFHRKRVEVVVSGPKENTIDATVKGKRVQRVRLYMEDGKLASACTCCPRLLGPAACKHVWATLLEIDRRGLFESLRKTARALDLGVIEGPLRPRRPKRAVKAGAAVAKDAAPCNKSSAPAPRRVQKKGAS